MRWEYRVCDVPIGWNTSAPGEARELILIEMYYGVPAGLGSTDDDPGDGDQFLGWVEALGPAGDTLDDLLADVDAMRAAADRPIVHYEDLRVMMGRARRQR